MTLKAFERVKDFKNFEQFPLVYTRNSIAYEGNGSPLQVNQPSFIGEQPSILGYRSEESFQNLLTLSQSNCSSLIGINKIHNTEVLGLNNGITVTTNGIADDGIQLSLSSVNGQPYTFYAVVIAPNDFNYNIAVNYSYNQTNYIGNGLPQIIKVSHTSDRDTGQVLYIKATNGHTPTTFTIKKMIVINKPYSLSYIPGQVTKQPDNLYIPKNEVLKFLDLNEGCIECLINAKDFHKLAGTNIYMLYDMRTSDTNGLYGYFSNAQICGAKRQTAYSTIPMSVIALPVGLQAYSYNYQGSNHGLSLTPSTLDYTHVINDGLKTFNDLNIGMRYTRNSGWFNSNIKWLVFSKPRTFSERKKRMKEAVANGHFKIDKKVLAFVPLENNLIGYRRLKATI